MRKKILIIGICLVVMLVLVTVGCIFIVKEDPGKYYVILTGVPTYISNNVMPSPNLTKKSNEETREIVEKLLIEKAKANYSYQMVKALEIHIKLVRLGNPIIPVLIELIQGKNLGEDEKIQMGAYEMSKIGVARNEAMMTLREIINAKIIPLEKKLQEINDSLEESLVPIYQNYLKRFYRCAKRIDVDIDKIVLEFIGILGDALPDKDDSAISSIADFFGDIKDKRGIEILIKAFNSRNDEEVKKRVIEGNRKGYVLDDEDRAKNRIEIALVAILKETKDKRIAEALDKDGSNYMVWAKIDREMVINKAIEALKKDTTDKYAISALGVAKAKEAVPMLIEILDREKDIEKTLYSNDEVIDVLGSIGTDKAVERLIELYKGPPQGGGIIIEALGNSKNRKAILFLENIVSSNDKYDEKGYETDAGLAAKALKKITGKEYKYKR